MADDPVLEEIAAARGLTAVQVALAALLVQPDVIAIPKAMRVAHQRENLAAVDVSLTPAEMQAIERRFPRPVRQQPLAMN
jgi:diketogulonate reductase-like aldo/keto reductase